jgi:predicted anti-sigma-YlaC factor YlaD
MRNNQNGNPALTSQKMGCGNETAQMAISSYLDGEAGGLEQALAEWHLAECRECNLLLSRWGQDSGRLRQAARDPELDRLAGAIAGQTRRWLLAELLAPPVAVAPEVARPRLRPAPAARFQPLRGGFVAAIMAFITILGVSLGTLLSGPDFRPPPAVATIDRTVPPATVSPTVMNTTARPSLISATPAAPKPSLVMVLNSAAQTISPRVAAGTPFLGYAPRYTAFTPSVGRVSRSGS